MVIPARFVLTLAVLVGLPAACSFSEPTGTATTAAISQPLRQPSTTTTSDSTSTTMSPENATAYPRTSRIAYGTAAEQFGDLTVPSAEPSPVVVLIHGGFWRNPYDLGLMEPLADDLVERGYAVWNIEYRRLGDDGGGWPGTLVDVADAIDALATIEQPIDLTRVAVVGHSAGGHLALWAAGRSGLPPDAPGAEPVVVPTIGIGQGAVVDLEGAAAAGLGNGAVVELLGDVPTVHPDRYRWATPKAGAGTAMVSVVGTADNIVPQQFSADPQQPDAISVIVVEGADHFDLIDPGHAAWAAVTGQLDDAIAP